MKGIFIRTLKVTCLLIISIQLSSCEDIFKDSEEKIIGTWKYEKVMFQKNHRNYTQNVTSDYSDIILEFTDNHDALLILNESNDTLFGYWEIERYEIYDEYTDTYANEELLFFEVVNFDNKIDTYIWEGFGIYFDKITATEYMSDGIYTYELERI